MNFSTIIAKLMLIASALATYVSFDPGYDDASRPLNRVSCSDGPNGLITRYHWHTQGQVAGFPSIGGLQGATWNSPMCGTCYELRYGNNRIHVLVVDATYNGGFNIGLAAMNALTNGNAVAWGHVDAQATLVAGRKCGLPW